MATFIQPDASPAPLEGDALEDAIQPTLAGVAGLALKMTRPRWQPDAPNIPDFNSTWAAFGISSTSPDGVATFVQIDELTQELQRDEFIIVLASFYGPQAQARCDQLNDGMQVERNRWPLLELGLKFQYTGEPVQVPALLKQTWVKRFDLRITFRRRKTRRYSVPSVVSVETALDNEQYRTDFMAGPINPQVTVMLADENNKPLTDSGDVLTGIVSQ